MIRAAVLRALAVRAPVPASSAAAAVLLQQRFAAAAAAKSKAKGKAPVGGKGAKKKKASSASGSGGGGGPAARRAAIERLSQAPDAGGSAVAPSMRHLSPRQRLRAARMARQEELEARKAKLHKKTLETVSMGPPGLDYIALGLVDEAQIPQYELTVEDGRRLAKEYSRVVMRNHRARQAAESGLKMLQEEAVAALPEKLRAAALLPDQTPFPAVKYMTMLVPEAGDAAEKARAAAKRPSVKEKLR